MRKEMKKMLMRTLGHAIVSGIAISVVVLIY